MNYLKTRGVILRRTDYGEADRIITFLTSDYGKIQVIAKGVRKQKSKMAGGIELFSVSELQFIKGKGDIGTLVSTRLLHHHGRIVKDLERTETAYAILKTANKTIEDQAGSEYYQTLYESLAALDNPKVPPVLTEASFTMRWLQHLGHVPQFTVDSRGNRLSEQDSFEFDFESTGFKPAQNGPFNKNHIKILKLLAHNNPVAVAQVQGAEDLLDTLMPLVRNLGQQYL